MIVNTRVDYSDETKKKQIVKLTSIRDSRHDGKFKNSQTSVNIKTRLDVMQ